MNLTSTYFGPLFKKMKRDIVLNEFNEWLDKGDLKGAYNESAKEILFELLVMKIAEERYCPSPTYDSLADGWHKNIPDLQVRFSYPQQHYNKEFLKEPFEFLISKFDPSRSDNALDKNYLEELKAEITLAEYRGIEYKDKPIPVPKGMLFYGKSQPFVANFFPTKLKFHL